MEAPTILATAKFTSFSFLLRNKDAYFRERGRNIHRTKTHKNEEAKKENAKKNRENAKKKKQQQRRIKTKTQKNASSFFWGTLQKPVDTKKKNEDAHF